MSGPASGIGAYSCGLPCLAGLGAAILLAGAVLWGWIWRSRPPAPEQASRETALLRHAALLGWLAALVAVVFLSAGVLVHQDAPWYQSIDPNENRAPPALYAIVFLCYPAYLAIGGAIYLHLRTRLPRMLRAVRWYLLVAVAAPFAFLPHLDAGLADQRLTLGEGLYLAAYWAVLALWLAGGIGPLVAKSGGAVIGLIARAGCD